MAFPLHPAPRSYLDRHRQLAPTASVRVSPICLGAMNFGTAWESFMGKCPKETAFAILDYFTSQGGNFIDTANTYQDEQSEVWLGEWLSSRNNRDQIVLATKYTSGYKSHEPEKLQSNYGRNGAKSLRISVELSLAKFQTSYLDILYIHWWDYTTSILELMHALNDPIVSGKVLYLGISDTPAWIVSKANQYARDHGLRPFVVYQGLWNAASRDLERDIIPMCRDEDMGILPYGTLGQGRMSEAGYREREEQAEEYPGRKVAKVSPVDRAVSKILEKIAASKDAQIVSVAMAYTMHKTPYVFPLVGCRTGDHLKGSIAALRICLTEKEIKEIESAYDFDHGFPHTFLSGSMRFGGDSVGAQTPAEVWMTKRMGNFDWVEEVKPIRPAVL